MILCTNVVFHILDAIGFGLETRLLRRQFAGVERFGHEGVFRDLINPLDSGSEDFGVDFVAEIARIDFGRGQRVGTLDVDRPAG